MSPKAINLTRHNYDTPNTPIAEYQHKVGPIVRWTIRLLGERLRPRTVTALLGLIIFKQRICQRWRTFFRSRANILILKNKKTSRAIIFYYNIRYYLQ